MRLGKNPECISSPRKETAILSVGAAVFRNQGKGGCG